MANGSISTSTIATYIGVFLLVIVMVAVGYQPPVKQDTTVKADAKTTVVTQGSTATAQSSVDPVVATTIASSLAESTDMPISNNVANLSQSLAVESTLAQTDTNVISKPQIVQPTASGRSVQVYKTTRGDTVQSVADKYGLNKTTIRWANNLTSDALEPGRKLKILPTDGILYTVRSGDTINSLVNRYGANRNSLVAYNDLELSGKLTVGSQIIVPDGTLPTTERPGYVATTTNSGSYGGGYGSAYSGVMSAGNRYAWGNCTWYAYERRMQLGLPVGSFWGNASTWAYNARAAGLTVNGTPTAGAIMANGGGYGHVSIVESVNPGKSITISEMNGYRFGGGFARVGHGSISWSEATSGYYQYIH